MKIVYTYGVFDLFHSGHVQLLNKARSLGDQLIVGIFTDDVVEGFKRMPVIPHDHRIAVIEALEIVDKVVAQDELRPDKNLLQLKPHVLAKGPGAGWEEGSTAVPGGEVMQSLGGEVVMLPYHHGISTSQIIEKLRSDTPLVAP